MKRSRMRRTHLQYAETIPQVLRCPHNIRLDSIALLEAQIVFSFLQDHDLDHRTLYIVLLENQVVSEYHWQEGSLLGQWYDIRPTQGWTHGNWQPYPKWRKGGVLMVFVYLRMLSPISFRTLSHMFLIYLSLTLQNPYCCSPLWNIWDQILPKDYLMTFKSPYLAISPEATDKYINRCLPTRHLISESCESRMVLRTDGSGYPPLRKLSDDVARVIVARILQVSRIYLEIMSWWMKYIIYDAVGLGYQLCMVLAGTFASAVESWVNRINAGHAFILR